jgi:hypothetical protein
MFALTGTFSRFHLELLTFDFYLSGWRRFFRFTPIADMPKNSTETAQECYWTKVKTDSTLVTNVYSMEGNIITPIQE